MPKSDIKNAKLQNEGYVFLPHNCKEAKTKCKLHVCLHGGKDGNEKWVTQSMNVLQYAASNDIIVLYPFATKKWMTGEHESDFQDWTKIHTKDGIQQSAIMGMISRLTKDYSDIQKYI